MYIHITLSLYIYMYVYVCMFVLTRGGNRKEGSKEKERREDNKKNRVGGKGHTQRGAERERRHERATLKKEDRKIFKRKERGGG